MTVSLVLDCVFFDKNISFWFLLAKLESEFKYIQLQHGQLFEQQSKDLHILQEKVMSMDDNIEEIRRRLGILLLVENKN